MKFEMSGDFMKKFNVSKNKIGFKTHILLDEFVQKLFIIDVDFEKNYNDEFQFLKSLDRSFWMKHLKLLEDLNNLKEEKKTLIFEKYNQIADTERLDSEIKRKTEEMLKFVPLQKIEANWTIYDCPCGDPMKRQSIIL